MPSDADSLTEPDVDDLADASADDRDPIEDADAEAVESSDSSDDPDDVDDFEDADVPTGDAGADTDAGSAIEDDVTPIDSGVVEDAEIATVEESDGGAADSPFGDDLRLPDEDGYDGVDYMDDDSIYGDDENGEFLFDGDPDDFELDLGPVAYPDAGPRPGDLLVLDDAAGHAGPPPRRRMSRMERRRRVRLQARRVRRIIRHVEPWSVLKISIFFYACLWVIFLVAGFMIWGVAESSGTVDKLESLIRELFALDTFDFDAGQIFRGFALGGLALSIAGTTFNVLMCLLFNLISDLTGGLRITMIEEESARPIPPRRRRRRRPPRSRPPLR